VTISVSELGKCAWFGVDDAVPAFAFAWDPYAVSFKCSVEPELVTVETVYREGGRSATAIHMIRRLADVDGSRIAFHDALFVSAVLSAQRRGFATEMLRRCVAILEKHRRKPNHHTKRHRGGANGLAKVRLSTGAPDCGSV